MSQPMNSASFNLKCRDGLQNYKDAKKIVCFLTISQSWGDNTDILLRFRELNRRVVRATTRKYIPHLEYIGVRVIQLDLEQSVSRQHLHVFWVKPFLKFDVLKGIWESILHVSDQPMTCSTVSTGQKSVDRVVNYCLTQNEEHYTGNILYICSTGWGDVKIKCKAHKKTQPSWRKRKYNNTDNSPWLVKDENGKELFLSDKEYEQYKRDHEKK